MHLETFGRSESQHARAIQSWQPQALQAMRWPEGERHDPNRLSIPDALVTSHLRTYGILANSAPSFAHQLSQCKFHAHSCQHTVSLMRLLKNQHIRQVRQTYVTI